jgi:hypothetical protein
VRVSLLRSVDLCLDQVVDSHDKGVGTLKLVEMVLSFITCLSVGVIDDLLAHVSDKVGILHLLLNQLEVLSLKFKLLPFRGQSFIMILGFADEIVVQGGLIDIVVLFVDLDVV